MTARAEVAALDDASNGTVSGVRRVLCAERFVELGFLGAGGMSVVVRAFDRTLLREVAVKLLPPEWENDEMAVADLEREARTLGALDHPRIPTVYDLGRDERGARFIAMKLIIGETLDHALKRAEARASNAASLARLLGAFVQACEIVAFAHARGLLHLDLKPSNIMVGPHGEAYVIDWGVARRWPAATGSSSWRPSQPVGTPGYMAPEHLVPRDTEIDERADVFSLGVVLHQIVSEKPTALPNHIGRSPPAYACFDVLSAPRPRGAASTELVGTLASLATRATSFDPSERPAGASVLAQEVARACRQASFVRGVRARRSGSVPVRSGSAFR